MKGQWWFCYHVTIRGSSNPSAIELPKFILDKQHKMDADAEIKLIKSKYKNNKQKHNDVNFILKSLEEDEIQ